MTSGRRLPVRLGFEQPSVEPTRTEARNSPAERAGAADRAPAGLPAAGRISDREGAASRRTLLDTVVVTGPHRSGTTFLASVLAQARKAVLFDVEPLNAVWGLQSVHDWYPLLRGEEFSAPASDLLRLRSGRPVRWRNAYEPPLAGAKIAARTVERAALLAGVRSLRQTLILKDPFLSLSLGFASERLTQRPVVVSMRHPAAWAMSLRRVDWHPGALLDSLATDPEYAELAASVGLLRRRWTEVPILEASAWTWRALTVGVLRQLPLLPDGSVVLVPLETMREDPAGFCLDLIARVGLRTSSRSEQAIRRLTEGTEVVPATQQQHVLRRDTRSSLDAWQSRLAPEDRDLIWRIAGDVAQEWYQR